MSLVETINSWLPIVGALCGGLLFIWRITYNLNKTLINLNNEIGTLNKNNQDTNIALRESKEKIDNHEIRIVVLETVTGIKPIKGESKYEN